MTKKKVMSGTTNRIDKECVEEIKHAIYDDKKLKRLTELLTDTGDYYRPKVYTKKDGRFAVTKVNTNERNLVVKGIKQSIEARKRQIIDSYTK